MPVQLVVTVSDVEYRKLVRIAEVKQVNAHHLIEAQVTRALTAAPTGTRRIVTRELRNRIWEMNVDGAPDRVIAEALELSYWTVSRERNAMGLPANGPIGRKKKSA